MILGNKKTEKHLLRLIENKNNIAHAFLFSGPQNTGKSRFAIEFAKALICQEDKTHFGGCGRCDACKTALNKSNPDFIYFDPKQIGKDLGKSENVPIEKIRELKKTLQLKPYFEKSYKVAVINDAHSIAQEGFNALLKLLEEPPKKSVLVLVTPYPEALPNTIISRMQNIKFSKISKEEIKKYLLDVKLDNLIEHIDYFSENPDLLFDKNYRGLDKRKKAIDGFYEFLEMPLEKKYDHAETLVKKENELSEVIDSWLFAVKKSLLLKAERAEDFENTSQKRIEKNYITRYGLKDLAGMLKELIELNHILKTTNVNKKIALDTFILKLEPHHYEHNI